MPTSREKAPAPPTRATPPKRNTLSLLRLGGLLLIAGVLVPMVCDATPARGPWRRISAQEGIVISTRAVPGQNLPEFRGVAVVEGTLFDLLGIVVDVKRHCEWRAKCHSARLIRKINAFEQMIYTRIDAPWPVSDRDVVLRGKAMVNIKRRIVVSSFHAVRVKSVPNVSGVVRMPHLQGSYRLEELDKTRVRVTYQVYSDPGGMLPAWLAARSARQLPYKTLTGLRKRVKKTRGTYDWMKKQYDPALGGVIPNAYRLDPPPKTPTVTPTPPTGG